MAGWTDGLAVGRPVVAVAGGARRTTHHQRQQSGRRLVDATPTGPTLGPTVTSVTPGHTPLASIRHGVNAGGLGDKDDKLDRPTDLTVLAVLEKKIILRILHFVDNFLTHQIF